MVHGLIAASSAVRQSCGNGDQNEDVEYIYEEKYLDPKFRKFLQSRKNDTVPPATKELSSWCKFSSNIHGNAFTQNTQKLRWTLEYPNIITIKADA